MNEHLQELKCGGRPMTKLELLQKENEELKHYIEENNSVSLAKYNKLKNEKEQLELTLSVIKDNRLIIKKAIEYIKENCIKSDKWDDLGFCNFVPTGKISYISLSVKKVKELLNILKGEK